MKILIAAVLVQCFTFYASAQTSIKNTKWKGQIEVPQSLEIIFEFRNDTLIASTPDGTELEQMSFSQINDTLRLKKLSGSPCDNVSEGSYRLEWLDSGYRFLFHSIRDDCTDRGRSIASSTMGFYRVKN